MISGLLLLTVATHSALAQEKTTARIISTDAGVTDVLIALGMTKQIVGVDVTSQLPAESKIPRLGYHRTLSTEGLLSLNPSLIIGSTHMGPPETIAALKTYPLTLMQLDIASNEAMLAENIKRISALADKQQEAKPLLQHIDSRMLVIKQQQLPSNTRVAFLLHMEGRGLRLAGKGTTGNDIIALLGGENAATHNSYRSVSAEALLSLEPEVIIIAGQKGEKSVAGLMQSNPMLRYTPAGKQKKIIAVESHLLVAGISLKAIDAVAELSSQLYPVATP
ncbi:hypothetical protein BST96_06295 [Oceanicoccus sagamiensis]|uniref:Fe/B12 periplasmic-binding domain-containing protein n=1 Tax=Oceanicoccus sagamiensis TaxID=716816 RepID=A0A1X9NE52_9GAMM|nr:hypothetical protein BST96_06295 [Oceanicoccus sagamiensis]